MPEPIDTREQALDFLFRRINYERASAGSMTSRSFKLDRMRGLLELLGNPQQRLPAVHIAGTKGKGSTAAMAAAMLSAAGYRAGLFTSPHVYDFAERMRVDGAAPDDRELVELANLVAAPAAEMDRRGDELQPTYFEVATAMAWLYFARRGADVAVMEVGLGGRLDSTNLCAPEVTVITNVSYDHTAVLGSTLAEIAGEKAGIVKPGVPVVSGVLTPEPRTVVRKVCRSLGAPLYELDAEITVSSRAIALAGAPGRRGRLADVVTPWRDWPAMEIPLAGEHQTQNAALALAALDVLHSGGRAVPADAARRGLARLAWPLRIEVLGERPTIVVDAAHNVASSAALAQTLQREFLPGRRILVFAATRDKDYRGMLRELAPLFETIVLTRYVGNPRGVPIDRLQAILQSDCGRTALAAENPQAACGLALSLATADHLVCATGSFFLAAEAREIIAGRLERRAAAETKVPAAASISDPLTDPTTCLSRRR